MDKGLGCRSEVKGKSTKTTTYFFYDGVSSIHKFFYGVHKYVVGFFAILR